MTFDTAEMLSIMPDLKKFALRLTRNPADSEDLLQDTLLRMMQKRDLFQPGSRLFSWASKMMFNLFAAGHRVKVRRAAPADSEPYLLEAAEDARAENQMILKEVVGKAATGLNEQQREILGMAAMEMSYDEIAREIGIPLGTVRSRLCRARRALSGLLEGESLPDAPAPLQRLTELAPPRVSHIWPFFRKYARRAPSAPPQRGKRRLTEEQAHRIISHAGPLKELAREFGVTPATVYCVRSGRTWRHLHNQPKGENHEETVNGQTC